jgi:hypothetical protein
MLASDRGKIARGGSEEKAWPHRPSVRQLPSPLGLEQRLIAPCNELPNSEANGHLDDRQIEGNDQPRSLLSQLAGSH